MSFRVVVLVSGSGTLLQALLDAVADGTCSAEVVAVGADRADAYGLTRAEQAGVETFCIPMEKLYRRGTPERLDWDQRFTDRVNSYRPDLVVLAGFMKLFDTPFMTEFSGRLINTHPSMLPAFPGAHAVRDALAAGAKETGASIFWVDEGIDTGEMIAQIPVPILVGDTEEVLHERIKVTERKLLVDTVNKLAAEGQKNGC